MKIVVFTPNNARILHNPSNAVALSQLPNCVVDPDLSAVKGLPPHFWKLQDGKVVPKTRAQQTATLAHHARVGVINEIEKYEIKARSLLWLWIAIGILTALSGSGLWFYLK